MLPDVDTYNIDERGMKIKCNQSLYNRPKYGSTGNAVLSFSLALDGVIIKSLLL